MKRRLLTLFMSMVFMIVQVMAQQKTVTGRVTSADDGSPLPGVSVKVRGTSAGVSTDSKGTFSIKVSPGQVLVFSFVGSTPQERTVGEESVINIKLTSDSKALNEVVVVGYGTQKKSNLTGSVSSIDVKKALDGRPISDVGRAIQGSTPGLSVVIPSGEVGSDPVIKIRGQIGSIIGGSSPLILVDNVEIPSIQLVNPSDIASISVLKDAASASIYGAKAAFGVVLITTKKGTGTGRPQISYTNNFSFQNPWKELKMGDVNSLKYTMDAVERVGSTFAGAFYYVNRESYERAVAWKEKYGSTIGPDDPTVYGRDWYFQPGVGKMGVRTYNPYDYMVKEWAPTQQHNLSIGGTANKTSYDIGLGLLNQSGMMKPAKKDEFSRYNASVRVNSEINKYFTARAGAMYSRRNKEYPYVTNSTTADPWLYLYRWAPIYPFGNDENGDAIRSPASETAAANTASLLYNYLNLNLGGTLNITSNWKVDFDYTFANQEHVWNRPGTRYTARNSWVAPVVRNDNSGNAVYVNDAGEVVSSTAAGAMRAYDLVYQTYTANGSNPDHLYRLSENVRNNTINAFSTYNWKLNEDHDFKFILGLNRVTNDTENHYTQVTNLTDITNPQFSYGIGTWTGGGEALWESQLGYFGRVNYAYKNKYLFEGNLRHDGTSKFGEALQWKWFPSFSAGWVVSEESFMEWSKQTLNQLKFRGSWGSIGDQTVPNTLYQSILTSGISNWIGGDGAKLNYVGTPSAIKTDPTWQEINTLDFGVDLSLLNNRLGMTFDWYQRDTKNMLVPQEGIPVTFGTIAPYGNYGNLRTEGWEFALTFNHRFENGLGINLAGNISNANSIVKEYGSTQALSNYYVGKNIGEIWGYRTDRLFQMDDFDLDANGNPQLITLTTNESKLYAGKKAYKLKSGPNGESPVYQTFLQNSSNFYFGPGDVKFVDINGDGEINNGSSTIGDHGDLELIGNSQPKYEYGFRLGGDYKGFDLSVFFQGVGSRKVWGDGFLAIPGYNSSDGAMPAAIVDNYWRPDNTGAFYPRAYNNGASNSANNMQIQSRYLLNMAYLRLKNLSFGYSLPKSFLSKISVNSLRVYMSLENIWTWDHLNGLPIDPEYINGYSMYNKENYNSGRTGAGVPAFKSVSFGAQLNF
ncbi:TonB-linked SusC/RagA family outer membrane protein [Arcticibacter tournemirensis]|uniref:TonB-dependent receptor n=1 Tax=Arcticibacter tournemirensis TaxID=699437 RepID=A0A5M9HDW6_9SPHI|nr:TonB-dependent receptor [Arcticibacter tournemirensis]KAA8483097.1 TonB-dependent receptor [Arcticibacter tournemirensis]TQM51990.1 TonB-linked SusC/RagA family outer membrane protein [Arcticibacter tournemirensis]